MTTRDHSNPQSLATLMRYRERKLRERIFTSAPANVISYNANTRRAVVQPALRMMLENGATRSRSPLVDVPVLAQAGAGFLVHVPLEAGDAVMLGFSMRGYSLFKRTLAESNPDAESVLSPAGAYVLGSFVEPDAALAATDGSCSTEHGRLRVGSRPCRPRCRDCGRVVIHHRGRDSQHRHHRAHAQRQPRGEWAEYHRIR